MSQRQSGRINFYKRRILLAFRQKGDFSKHDISWKKPKEAVSSQTELWSGRESAALASATPVDSGLTADSWRYEITNKQGSAKITFYNSNIQNGVPSHYSTVWSWNSKRRLGTGARYINLHPHF